MWVTTRASAAGIQPHTPSSPIGATQSGLAADSRSPVDPYRLCAAPTGLARAPGSGPAAHAAGYNSVAPYDGAGAGARGVVSKSPRISEKNRFSTGPAPRNREENRIGVFVLVCFGFWTLFLFRISDFGFSSFRISDLGFRICPPGALENLLLSSRRREFLLSMSGIPYNQHRGG
jgi:hypothetical protein